MAYEEIETTPIKKLEAEESIEGNFVGFQTGSYGENPILNVKGEEVVLAGDTALLTKMKKVEQEAGVDAKVRITRLDDAKSASGRIYHDYRVEVDK